MDPLHPAPQVIAEAAAVIRRGGLVAFPTETVYGLGADALAATAVAGIFAAKGRDLDDPCIVHIADLPDLVRVAAHIPDAARAAAAAFWPGPLSLVLPRAAAVPDNVTAGRTTVAVRMPAHPVALALIRAAAVPIAAPSANRFMHTSPTTAAHVAADLTGRIDLILDGGPTPVGVESTVLDLAAHPPVVLRPGGVSVERLRAVLGEVQLRGRVTEAEGPASSPGLMDKHYAPDAEMLLYDGDRDAALAAIAGRLRALVAAGVPAGALLSEADAAVIGAAPGVTIEPLGRDDDDGERAAARLFAALRALESAGVRVIAARLPPPAGLGLAVRDRLSRAAGGRVLPA